MSNRVNRAGLLACLDSVQPGISPKNVVEQSSCVVFRNGWAMTYNDEVSCKMPSGLDKTILGAVESKPLMDMLRKMPEDEVGVSLEDGKLTLSGKGRTARFVTETEILLPVKMVEKASEWKPLNEDFAKAVGIVQHSSGRDEVQFYVNCVHVHPEWVEARDGTQFCRWPLDTGVSKPILVRSEALRGMVSLGMTEIAETGSWLHFRNESGLVYSCRTYLEEFPDMTDALKVKGVRVGFPKGLVEELDRAKVLSKASSTTSERVLVEMKPGRLKLTGSGVYGEYVANPKLRYDGEPMSFLVSPDMLAEIVKEHAECRVGSNRLKVNGGAYIWVGCLGVPGDSEGSETEEGEEEAGDEE